MTDAPARIRSLRPRRSAKDFASCSVRTRSRHSSADGFLAVRQAFTSDVCRRLRRPAVWERLSAQGIQRDHRDTWTKPVAWVSCPEGRSVRRCRNPRLPCGMPTTGLIGPGRWPPRRGVGGSIPVRFSPARRIPVYAGWHFRKRHGEGGRDDVVKRSLADPRPCWRSSLFTDIGAQDAPTHVLRGSHLDVVGAARPGQATTAWSGRRSSRTCHRRPSNAKSSPFRGRPATCSCATPSWCTAPPGPHRGRMPRMMAQPSIWLKEPYTLTDRAGALPVETGDHCWAGRGVGFQWQATGTRLLSPNDGHSVG